MFLCDLQEDPSYPFLKSDFLEPSGMDPIFQEMVLAGAEDIAEIITVEAGKIGIDNSMAFGIVSAEMMAKDLGKMLDHFKGSDYKQDQASTFFENRLNKNLFHTHTREGVKNELLDALKHTQPDSHLANILLCRVTERLRANEYLNG